ncbi:hypothetical protein HBH43_112770 [Parastagonospora nodorum]|nr:hypothetical protein HBH43_112770 [Parastagonospora nodorum]KAH4189091.1 hypothetical protein HBH42_139230 [Parastagonospora nodorum]KAH5448737.1 hypothetical protein HBI30_165260 [Parastagonospora nodorum]
MAAQENTANNAMLRTLNSALGNLGGRQKSWMASSNAAQSLPAPSELTVKTAPSTTRGRGRPRGRPRKYPATQSRPQPQPPTVEHSIEPQVDPQPPSNPTSPQLANVLTNHDQAHLQLSTITVFPSPTPSEENTHNPQSASLYRGDGTTNVDFMQLDSDMAQSFVTLSDAGLRRRKPPEEAVAHILKRRRGAEGGQEHPATTASAYAQSPLTRSQSKNSSRPIPVPQHLVLNMHLEPLQTRSPSIGQSPNSPMLSPQCAPVSEAIRNAPQACMPSSRRTSSSAGVQNPSNIPTGMDAQNFPQPAWQTTQHCLHLLDALAQSPDAASFCALDASRIAVLRTAAQAQDWAYLSMHQLYCLLDFNPSLLSAQITRHPNLNSAVHVLSNVLELNRNLSPLVLQFCSNFPCHLEDIRTHWSVDFAQRERMFVSFITSSSNYVQLKRNCEARRFPPLAGEMLLQLGVTSETFQRILFTAVLRALWQHVPQRPPQYEAQAVDIFKQNQALHSQKLTRAGYDAHQINMDNQLALQLWGPRLRAVVEELELAANAPHLGGPTSHLQLNPRYNVNATDMASRGHNSQQMRAARVVQVPTSRVPPPRVQPALSSHSLQSHAPLQPSRQAVPLLPPPGVTQPQQRQPNPTRFSLHQAHLRSPTLKALSADKQPLYQYVQGFVKPPQRLINVGRAVEKWTFNLDAEMIMNVPATLPGLAGDVAERLVDTNSKTIRLRCIKWAPNLQCPDDHLWTTTDTSWIPHSYFIFNGVPLTQRKKVHHGKDLPIDVTNLIQEGENVLEMTVISEDKAYLNYLVAFEYLGITSHEIVKRNCLEKKRLPAGQILSDMKSKLRSNDDDEIAIVESNLTINLFDPFSASKMCDIPVRSTACRHPDCFDLETYLQTRRRKGDASMPDLWRCPICNSDARPGHLIVDGFLQEVKQELDARGLSKTRAIVVQQDGTWKPKTEVREGVSDDPPSPRRKSVPAPSEVIDLCD